MKSIFCGVLHPAEFYLPRNPGSYKVCLLGDPASRGTSFADLASLRIWGYWASGRMSDAWQ